MKNISINLEPVIFCGGQAEDYAIEVLKNGGLGTRHLPTGRMVPHVLSKASGNSLNQRVPIGDDGNVLVQFNKTDVEKLQIELSIPQIGLELLNLGVSVWTAWRVHKAEEKIDALSERMAHVSQKADSVKNLLGTSIMHLDGLIRENALMLGLIIEHQTEIGYGLTLLRQELSQGFRSVHEALSSSEARREAQELEQQMRALFRYYELCSREMQSGRQPPTTDLRCIIAVATNLTAWLDTRLAAMPPGRAERLPLLVARAFALRLEVEARYQIDEAPSSRDKDFEHLRALISNELRMITDGAPLFAFAEERRFLIEQYIYLHRTLRGHATMFEFSDGRVIPFYPQSMLSWSDGLKRVREILAQRANTPVVPRLELKTLEEHNAWQRLAGLPRGGSDDEVERTELARVLGLPQENSLSENSLRELLRLGPTSLAEVRNRIKNEVE